MLNQEQREKVEARLREERDEVVEALRQFDRDRSQTLQEEAGEMSMYRFHMADIGTEAMEREKSFLFASKEGERLYRIDEALRRLYREPEQFDVCEECGGRISYDRLMIMPESGFCAACQRSAEQGAAQG